MRLDNLCLDGAGVKAAPKVSWRWHNLDIFDHVQNKQQEAKKRRMRQAAATSAQITQLLRERFTLENSGEYLAILQMDTIAKISEQKALDPVVFNCIFEQICLRSSDEEKLRLTASIFIELLNQTLDKYPPVSASSKWFWITVLTHHKTNLAGEGPVHQLMGPLNAFKELVEDLFDNAGQEELKKFLLKFMKYDFANIVLLSEGDGSFVAATVSASRGTTFNSRSDVYRFPLVLLLLHRPSAMQTILNVDNINVVYHLKEAGTARVYKKYTEMFCRRKHEQRFYAELIGLLLETQRFMDSGGRLAENPDASFLHEKFGKSSEMIGSVIEAHYNYEDDFFGFLASAGGVPWLLGLLFKPTEG